MKKILFALGLLSCAASVCAQQTRVILNGVPTNLRVDWSVISVSPDAIAGNAFLAFLPLENLTSWASFDAGLAMDSAFGAGNWLRCRMAATDWAYLSSQPCAHQSGSNAGVPYPAPLSLLTTSYDYGAYTGVFGQPNFPIADATLFGGNLASVVQGLDQHWAVESWQLRTRGFWLDDLWNGCAGSTSPTPNFPGWLAARFEFTFQ